MSLGLVKRKKKMADKSKFDIAVTHKNKRLTAMTYRACPIYLLLILHVVAVGCITTDSQIVERSKEVRPAWVDNADQKSLNTEDKLLFIEEGSNLRDLPLGIKATQLQALKSSRDYIQNKIVEHINLVSSDSGINLVNKARMTGTVAKVVKTSHNKFARVQDIYFEKIYNQNAEDELEREFYRVFVKVEYPKSQIDVILKNVSSRFSGSKLPDLGKIAMRLSKLNWKLYSH